MEKNNIVKNAVEFLLFIYFGLDREDGNKLDTILDRAIERAYDDATIQGAFNALFTADDYPDREAVEEFKALVRGMSASVKQAVIDLFSDGSTIDYDEWHSDLCSKLCQDYIALASANNPTPAVRSFVKASGYFRYGNAQKWVNMTIKNLYVISGAYLAMGGTSNEKFFNAVAERSNEFHIPLDNIILGAIYKQKLTGPEDRYYVRKFGKKDPCYNIATFYDDGAPWSCSWSNIQTWAVYENFRKELKAAIDEPPIEWECRNWIARKKQIKALKGDLTTIDD